MASFVKAFWMETNELVRFRVISRYVIILKSAWSEGQFIDLSELTYTHIHLRMWPGVFLSVGNQLLVVRSSLVTQPLVLGGSRWAVCRSIRGNLLVSLLCRYLLNSCSLIHQVYACFLVEWKGTGHQRDLIGWIDLLLKFGRVIVPPQNSISFSI